MERKIRWIRTCSVGIVVFLVATGVAFAPIGLRSYRESQAENVSPVLASPEEFESILAAVLEQVALRGVPAPPSEPGHLTEAESRKPLVLVNETIVICSSEGAATSSCGSMENDSMFLFPGGDLKIPKKFRQELTAANRTSDPFACPVSRWAKCSDSKTISAIFSNGGWWSDFYGKYPGTAGVVSVSRAVLSHDAKSALIYVAHSCDGLCGTGTLVLLQKTGAAWVVQRKEQLWVS